jgi:hypothetical protein
LHLNHLGLTLRLTILSSEATVEQKRKTSTSVGQRFRRAGISASKQARWQRVEAGGSRHLTFSRVRHISASSAGRPLHSTVGCMASTSRLSAWRANRDHGRTWTPRPRGCSRGRRAANQLIARQLWPFNVRGVFAAYVAKPMSLRVGRCRYGIHAMRDRMNAIAHNLNHIRDGMNLAWGTVNPMDAVRPAPLARAQLSEGVRRTGHPV